MCFWIDNILNIVSDGVFNQIIYNFIVVFSVLFLFFPGLSIILRVLSLLLFIVLLAFIFIWEGLEFIALLYILVYSSGITILFMFIGLTIKASTTNVLIKHIGSFLIFLFISLYIFIQYSIQIIINFGSQTILFFTDSLSNCLSLINSFQDILILGIFLYICKKGLFVINTFVLWLGFTNPISVCVNNYSPSNNIKNN